MTRGTVPRLVDAHGTGDLFYWVSRDTSRVGFTTCEAHYMTHTMSRGTRGGFDKVLDLYHELTDES